MDTVMWAHAGSAPDMLHMSLKMKTNPPLSVTVELTTSRPACDAIAAPLRNAQKN